MTARGKRSRNEAPHVARPARVRTPKPGKHVIDLTQLPSTEVRLAEYEAAFGLPSALHEHPSPGEGSRRGAGRLLSLVRRRGDA